MGRVHVISRDHTTFANRHQAADCLAELLVPYRGGDTIVVGIAGGGVILSDYVAECLGTDMDFTVSQKIHVFASNGPVVGAVGEDADIVLLQERVSWLKPEPQELALRTYLAGIYMRVQRSRYRAVRPPAPLEGRTVVLLDEGIATGATITAALRWVRKKRPSRIVVAVPLGPEESLGELQKWCDEFLCLSVPAHFTGIADTYEDFPSVDEQTVLAALEHHYDGGLLDDVFGES